jgi:hypothetical protein
MCGRRMHDDVNETKYLLTEEPWEIAWNITKMYVIRQRRKLS